MVARLQLAGLALTPRPLHVSVAFVGCPTDSKLAYVHAWCASSCLISRLHASQLLAHPGGERGAAVPEHAIYRGARNVRECECSGIMGLFARLVS